MFQDKSSWHLGGSAKTLSSFSYINSNFKAEKVVELYEGKTVFLLQTTVRLFSVAWKIGMSKPGFARQDREYRSVLTDATEVVRLAVAGKSAKEYTFPTTSPLIKYEAVHVRTATELFETLRHGSIDLVLLDSAMPDADNISVIHQLMAVANSPYILVRSETDDEMDRILALELGADDCVALSCSRREIKSRIRSAFRRRQIEVDRANAKTPIVPQPDQYHITHGGWTLHKGSRRLLSPTGEAISLTNAEFSILHGLFDEPGTTKDRPSLRRAGIDQSEDYNNRTINAFVSRLRKKLEKHGGENLIESVRGQGYRLNAL